MNKYKIEFDEDKISCLHNYMHVRDGQSDYSKDLWIFKVYFLSTNV